MSPRSMKEKIALAQFQEALEELLKEHQDNNEQDDDTNTTAIHNNCAYLEACAKAPHLEELQTMPLRFLRFCQYNANVAAQGFLNYWHQRKQIFGPDAFLLPMTMPPLMEIIESNNSDDESENKSASGDDKSEENNDNTKKNKKTMKNNITKNKQRTTALSPEAIEYFHSCVLVHLPRDGYGCSVVCYDPSRKIQPTFCARRQVAWYQGEVVSRNPKTQTDGYTVLLLMTEFQFDGGSQETLSMLQSTFPGKAKAWHVFNCISTRHSSCLVRSFIGGMERMFGHLYRNHDHFFYPSSQQDYVEILKDFGMDPEGLPRILGGNWSYQNGALPIQQELLEQEASLTVGVAGDTEHNDAVFDATPHTSLTSYSGNGQHFMQRTIDLVLSQQEKAPLLLALSKAAKSTSPIWSEESNWDWFLQVEDYHPVKAARRLARYWQLRHETFHTIAATDSDRDNKVPYFVKPVHQTGEGCLGRRELRVLGTQFVSLLPHDTMGRPVLSLDGSLLKDRRSMPNEATDRCLFYMFSLLAENEVGRNQGAVILYWMTDFNNSKATASSRQQRIDVKYVTQLLDCLPMRCAAFHIVSSSGPCADLEATMSDFADDVVVHDNHGSVEELVADLESYGLEQASLPKSVGGKWGLAQFIQWQELRTRIEFQLPLGAAAKQTSVTDFPGMRPYEELLEIEENKAERNRRANIIHCRRKRDHGRIREDILQDEHQELTQQKTRLVNENRRLTELVDQANAVVQHEKVRQLSSTPLISSSLPGMLLPSSYAANHLPLPIQDGRDPTAALLQLEPCLVSTDLYYSHPPSERQESLSLSSLGTPSAREESAPNMMQALSGLLGLNSVHHAMQ